MPVVQSALVACVALIVLAAGLGGLSWSSAAAQDAPSYRFFGFAGDVTIDGEPLEPGAVIVARIHGEEVGRAEVNAAGAWVLSIDGEHFDEATCNLVFEVAGLTGRQPADSCSLRVRLALRSDAPATGSLADELQADESGADDELTPAGPLVRPSPPHTGSGGLAGDESSGGLPRTAAITAALTLAAALAALLLSRRTDGAA